MMALWAMGVRDSDLPAVASNQGPLRTAMTLERLSCFRLEETLTTHSQSTRSGEKGTLGSGG